MKVVSESQRSWWPKCAQISVRSMKEWKLPKLVTEKPNMETVVDVDRTPQIEVSTISQGCLYTYYLVIKTRNHFSRSKSHPEKNNIKFYSFEVCQRSWPPQWGTRSQGTKTKYGKYSSKQNAVLRTPDPAKCLQMVSKQWAALARPHKYMIRRSQLPLLAFFLGILFYSTRLCNQAASDLDNGGNLW